jgi:hypothetical protein
MSKLFKRLLALLPTIKSQRDEDDEYLAQTKDSYDLERRLNRIQARLRCQVWAT